MVQIMEGSSVSFIWNLIFKQMILLESMYSTKRQLLNEKIVFCIFYLFLIVECTLCTRTTYPAIFLYSNNEK